ncbi:MAG: hypothetical protein KDC20_06895 [Bacteroidetes bacterium]|nr:hypothetical protein [Bacteroidota bacterium]
MVDSLPNDERATFIDVLMKPDVAGGAKIPLTQSKMPDESTVTVAPIAAVIPSFASYNLVLLYIRNRASPFTVIPLHIVSQLCMVVLFVIKVAPGNTVICPPGLTYTLQLFKVSESLI